MADIYEIILQKYEIDISKENILKLYKIESGDLSKTELEDKIVATRKKWNQSINGANEKNAARDRVRLEKADTYEKILQNDKLRKQLVSYYGREGGGKEAGAEKEIGFARDYFKLIGTSKRLGKGDVDFFFSYFQSERKNKKFILEMLQSEFKIRGLKNTEKDSENEKEEQEGKTQNDESPLVVNLFQEATIIKLKKCIDLMEKAAQTETVVQKYPNIEKGLYDFLDMQSMEVVQKYNSYVEEKGKELYTIRQEKGSEFIPLVDVFNTLQVLGQHQDVQDNFDEFKMLVRYPNLSPYMYSFVEMKTATLNGVVRIAQRDYDFRDVNDFILNYYQPIHDNFGITDRDIAAIIKKAEKSAKSNKVLKVLESKMGRNKRAKMSFAPGVLYYMLYWPILLAYILFEFTKVLINNLSKIMIFFSIGLMTWMNWFLPRHTDWENILYLRHLFAGETWTKYLRMVTTLQSDNIILIVMHSLLVVFAMIFIYIGIPILVGMYLHQVSVYLNKQYDWIGVDRTFKKAFGNLRERMQGQYERLGKKYIIRKLPLVLWNFVCIVVPVLVVLLLLHFI